jgi:hypothetical protein
VRTPIDNDTKNILSFEPRQGSARCDEGKDKSGKKAREETRLIKNSEARNRPG